MLRNGDKKIEELQTRIDLLEIALRTLVTISNDVGFGWICSFEKYEDVSEIIGDLLDKEDV
jgi:hypothetical protein